MLHTALFVLAAIAALRTLTIWCYRPPSWRKSVVKTASVALLALAVLVAGGPEWLIAALALGAFGDFALSRPGDRAFLIGLIAFAAAHLAYLVLFSGLPREGLSFWGLAALGALGGGMALALWPHTGALRWPVMGYVAVICTMGLAAFSVTGFGASITLSAVLFILSDTVLASEMFLLAPTHPLRRITPFLIWCTYWSAQAGFAATFLF